jgi:hypothetical protein
MILLALPSIFWNYVREELKKVPEIGCLRCERKLRPSERWHFWALGRYLGLEYDGDEEDLGYAYALD